MRWAQSTKKDYIRAERKLHSISKLLISQFVTPQVICFWAYLYSAGTQHGTLHPAGWPMLIYGPSQEPVLAAVNTGKNGRVWEKMQVNGPKGLKLARKKCQAGSVACMAIYWPTPGFNGRTFKLCVLIRWDFNFCVRRSPLLDQSCGQTMFLFSSPINSSQLTNDLNTLRKW